MKIKLQLLLSVSLLSLLLSPISLLAEAVAGSPAPNFTLTDINGESHTLSDFAGKTVVLEWTNHKCPFVKKHYETKNMQTLQSKYTSQGVVWLTINSSAEGKQGNISSTEAKELLTSQGAKPTAFFLDPTGEAGKLFGATTTPHMFIINPKAITAYAGAIDDNSSAQQSTVEGATNYVANALDSIIAQKPVAVASTQAYGCSVKYAG